MASQYVTLTKKDLEFESYLLGTFSKTEVAIPVESFGVGSLKERVTFQIQSLEEVGSPNWLYVYYKAIRPELLGLTLGHSLVAALGLLALFPKHNISISLGASQFFVSLVLSLLGVVFAHASGCLFNDFRDHMKGVDRRSVSKGSQVIQKGWCRAVDMKRWALVNALLAAGIGVYLFWGQWILFGSLLSLSALSILLHSWMIPFWNRLGAGDFWILFLFGPLLFFSVGLAILSPLHIPVEFYPFELWLDFLILSVALGLMASWTLQVRQLQGIFRMTQEGFRTVIARFSFDQAKRFLIAEGLVFSGLQILILNWIWPRDWTGLSMLFIFPFVFYFSHQLWSLKSPMSSLMQTLGRKALLIHGVLISLWLFSLWTH